MTTRNRIRRDVEASVEAILDRQLQGSTHAQTSDYIARLRAAEALTAEATEITALAEEERAPVAGAHSGREPSAAASARQDPGRGSS